MSRTRNTVLTIQQIESAYPNQWIAMAVLETDADGLASIGEVIAHNLDDRFVWPAIRLGELDAPVYVFHTGARQPVESQPELTAQAALAV